MLRVRVLGAFSLEEDGRPVALPRGRARQLLAYLALHPGRHPRAVVAAALWPEASPDVALHRLRTTVWDVRNALPAVAPLVLEVGGSDLGLHPAVDVDLLQAKALLEAGVAEAALELLEPGIAEEINLEWAEQGRRDVEARRLQALERLVQETGEVGVALAYAQQRLALVPLSEVAHNDVIRLLLASGDRSGAMAAYDRMRQVLDVELGVRPSARSRQLLSEMNADEPRPVSGSGAPAARGLAARPRVPYATTPLIGRDGDLAELDAFVRAHRLVSVVGPAGVGKSRVALAVVRLHAERGVPVAVAELATTRRAAACDYVVAAALDVHAGPARAIRKAILDRLELEPGVLVLDNCEHVLEPVRDLVADVLRSCRATTVLATSREPLVVAGERVMRLSPLPVPATDADDDRILASPAVELLAATVRRRSLEALRPSDTVRGLARIARQLDGLPLALELAAARIPSVGVKVLADRLDRGLDVLSARPGDHDRPETVRGGRHDSLIGALDVSMRLLSPEERTLLGLLSLLPGPFPLTAVEELVKAAGMTTDCVVGVARLVDASLIECHPGDPWSYSSLQTIQTFGRTLLDEDMARSARHGLVRWAEGFAQGVKAREYTDERLVNAEVMRFLPLVRAALHVAQDQDDVPAQRRIIKGIESWSIWREQPEVWSWIIDLAGREPEEDPDAEMLRMGALAAWRLGRLDSMRAFTSRCVSADPNGPNGRTATAALTLLAYAEHRWADVVDLMESSPAPDVVSRIIDRTLAATALARSGRPQAALEAARTARREAERVGAPSILAVALLAEAQASDAGEEDAVDRPQETLAEARVLADSVGSAELVAAIDKERGLQALRNGRSDLALEPLTTACLHWLGTGNDAPATRALRGLADALEANGSPDVASRLREAVGEDSLTPARLASIVRTARAEAAAETPSEAFRRWEPARNDPHPHRQLRN
jgi:predicted ATPase/DNA-binding SARP family transcriptional activator